MTQVQWTCKGRLKVRSQFPELARALGDANGDVPLAGVRVKVSAKESNLDPTGFQEWGEDVTDASGNFQITKQKDQSRRFFRVRVMFKGDDLKLYPDNTGVLAQAFDLATDLIPGGPVQKVVTELSEDLLEAALGAVSRLTFDVDWITVHEDQTSADKQGPGLVDFGDLTFRQGGQQELGGTTQRRHADLWATARQLRAQLNGLGSGLGYIESKPIAIKYPHSSDFIGDGIETAYADPLNNVVFLIQNKQRDNFDLQTAMHELMHLRDYQHVKGESGLAWQLIIHGSTHTGRQNQSWVPFHEAHAEFGKTELYRQMFGQGATIYGDTDADRRPFTRASLKSLGINMLSEIEHFEFGWLSVFNLLVCNKVVELDINGTGPFSSPTLEFARVTAGPTPLRRAASFAYADLLRAFDPLPGFPAQLTHGEMTVAGFFARLAKVNPAFDAEMQSAYLAILDPRGTQQPAALLPSSLTSTPNPRAVPTRP